MLLDRIELFVNVAKHQSLAKTARGMHVSPSSVSQRLKSLENDFGVKLYKRTNHGIELTDAGRMVLTTASQVLQQLDSLRNTLNSNVAKDVQTLTVGSTYNPSARCLPSAIAAFQKSHPEIKVTFLSSLRRVVERWLREEEVDLAMIQSPSESCVANFFAEHFAVDTLTLFAHPAHRLAKKSEITVQELAGTPLIVREGRGTTDQLLNLLRSRGLKLNIALRCATPISVKAAVRRKMGIGILFHNMLADEIRRKEIKVLTVTGLPRFVANSYIVFNKTKQLTPAATKFVALLREMKSRRKKPVNLHELTGTGGS
jgi:DNA-binding transcriptional LysR family regulator